MTYAVHPAPSVAAATTPRMVPRSRLTAICAPTATTEGGQGAVSLRGPICGAELLPGRRVPLEARAMAKVPDSDAAAVGSGGQGDGFIALETRRG